MPMTQKQPLLGLTLSELQAITKQLSMPLFTAKQMASWLYDKKVKTIDEMTNLSKAARAALNEKYEVGLVEYKGLQISSDGTKKYLFPVDCCHKRKLNAGCDGSVPTEEMESSAVEAVMIPDADRATLCVSSQAGCHMGCKFCMTGRQGFHGHMSAADIISQFIAVDESDRLTNAVFMGMGEPLDNYENVIGTKSFPGRTLGKKYDWSNMPLTDGYYGKWVLGYRVKRSPEMGGRNACTYGEKIRHSQSLQFAGRISHFDDAPYGV